MEDRLLEIETPAGERVYVPYDRLVIACGSSSNTHGVPGLEHCFQLKTIPDAQAIRRRIIGASSFPPPARLSLDAAIARRTLTIARPVPRS